MAMSAHSHGADGIADDGETFSQILLRNVQAGPEANRTPTASQNDETALEQVSDQLIPGFLIGKVERTEKSQSPGVAHLVRIVRLQLPDLPEQYISHGANVVEGVLLVKDFHVDPGADHIDQVPTPG